jgi:hypothetical protein
VSVARFPTFLEALDLGLIGPREELIVSRLSKVRAGVQGTTAPH